MLNVYIKMKLNLIWLPEGIIGFRRKRVGFFENGQVSWFVLRESWHLMTTNAADWYHAGGGRGRLRTEHVDIDTFAREHVASRGIVDVVGVQFRLDRLRGVDRGLVRIGWQTLTDSGHTADNIALGCSGHAGCHKRCRTHVCLE